MKHSAFDTPANRYWSAILYSAESMGIVIHTLQGFIDQWKGTGFIAWANSPEGLLLFRGYAAKNPAVLALLAKWKKPFPRKESAP